MLLYKQTERLIFLFKSRKRENAAKVKCSALQSKAESTSRAELSGADDVNKAREGRGTQKKNSPKMSSALEISARGVDSTLD